MKRLAIAVLVLVLVGGCTDVIDLSPQTDAGLPDGGVIGDAQALPDARPNDGGVATDAATPDAP